MALDPKKESQEKLHESGVTHAEIDVSASDYEPDAAFKGIYVGVSGNVAVTGLDDVDTTFVGLAAGVIHPIGGKAVLNTGTTATSIVVLR